jgi:hypothetical protein
MIKTRALISEIAIFISFLSFQGAAYAQTHWTGTINSDFNNAQNWSNGAPTSSANVSIPAQSNQPVLSGTGDTANLTLSSGAVLTVNPDSMLTVSGVLNNSGTLSLAPSATTFANLFLGSSGTSSNNKGANITLSDSSFNLVAATAAGATLVNRGDISGSGGITEFEGNAWVLNNAGTGVITALSAGNNALTISTGSISTNTGLMQAGDGGGNNGILTIASATFDNAGGIILANNGSTVNLQSAVINGGTLAANGTLNLQNAQINGSTFAGNGTQVTGGPSYLSGAVNIAANATVTVNAGSALYADSGLINHGTLDLAGSNVGYAQLLMDTAGTITNAASGAITLSDSGYNQIAATAGGATLVNHGSISGAGALSVFQGNAWVLDNTGTITATSAGANALTISPGSTSTNTGLMQAGDGGANNGTLNLAFTTFNNAGGEILANSGSTVNIESALVNGGTLSANGTLNLQNAQINGATFTGVGTQVIGGPSYFSGPVNIANGATVSVNPGGMLYAGDGFTNHGTLAISSSNSGYAQLLMNTAGAITNATSGVIALTDSGYNQIGATAVGATLVNHGTISGAGALSEFEGTAWVLDNTGTITATSAGANALTISPGGISTNTGLMQAGDGGANNGTLNIAFTTFNNAGGKILANNGSTVNIESALINGGTLAANGTLNLQNAQINGATFTGGGTQVIGGPSYLSGPVNIANGATVTVNPGGMLYAGDGLINHGTLALSSSNSGYAQLLMDTAGTITNAASGAITLSDSGYNQIAATAVGATLVNHGTISGAGALSVFEGTAWALDNIGTITAISAGVNALTVSPGATSTNTGLMQAGDGVANNGTLNIAFTTFNNAGGKILANPGSTVNIESALINGGTLAANGTLNLDNAQINGATFTGGGTQVIGGPSYFSGPVNIANGATVSVNPGGMLYAGDGLINHGTLALSSSNSGYAQLLMDTAGTITNAASGTITLTDSGYNQIGATATGATLLNHGTISGAGSLSEFEGTAWVLDNTGTVTATSAGANSLTISPGGISTNTGLMQAGDGGANNGTLNVAFTTINNAGGKILANNGSTVNIESALINGGTLTANGTLNLDDAQINGSRFTGAGTQVTDGPSYLSGAVRIARNAVVNVNPGSMLYAGDGLINHGTLALSGATWGYAQLLMDTAGTITNAASGAITLSDSSYNQIAATAVGATLVNRGTISGAGALSVFQGTAWALDNTGTITAVSAGANPLTVAPGAASTNTGLMQAGDGGANNGTLNIAFTTFNNAGGTILANTGSTVNVQSAVINGGTLTANGTVNLQNAQINGATFTGGGTQVIGGPSYLSGPVNIATGATVTVNPGGMLYAGSGLVNNGTLMLSGSNSGYAQLLMSSAGTVTNAGTITLTDSGYNQIGATATGATLVNNGTISGAGALNEYQGTVFNIVNNGAIVANGTNSLILDDGGDLTNNGTLRVASGSLFSIGTGTSLTNFSGGTLTGGTYDVYGTLQAGPLGTAGGEIVDNAADILLDGPTSDIVDASGRDALSALRSNSGTLSLLDGRDYTTAGDFDNSGTLDIGATDIFTVNGSYDPPGTADLTIELAGLSTSGMLDITDDADFGGTLDLEAVDGLTLSLGDTFYIAEYGSRGGTTFSSIDSSGLNLVPGLAPQILYDQGPDSDEVEVVIVDPPPTPEPSTWILLTGGLGILAALHRRQSRHRM